MLETLIDVFFPPQCSCCGAALRLEERAVCLACTLLARPFSPRVDGLDEVGALGAHEGPLRSAIHALKFSGEHWRGRGLGRWMASTDALSALVTGETTVIPVPLSQRRLFTRGYNQAAELARGFGSAMRQRVSLSTLRRTRGARSQASRDRADRGYDENPFRAVRKISGDVLLVDDVVTTGATLSACAEALRNAGAARVRAVTLSAGGDDARVASSHS